MNAVNIRHREWMMILFVHHYLHVIPHYSMMCWNGCRQQSRYDSLNQLNYGAVGILGPFNSDEATPIATLGSALLVVYQLP
jgi:hypothetical protein